MNTAFQWLSLVASRMWPKSIVFLESLVAQHNSHWQFLALMELQRWLKIICMDMGIPTFGCPVRFNPWYVDFISGLSSCENQPPCSWLIVELLALLWAKNCKWSYWKSFVCGLKYSAGLLCYVSWPSLQLWYYCVGCVPERISWKTQVALNPEVELLRCVYKSCSYIKA